jgi:hypothetical protein
MKTNKLSAGRRRLLGMAAGFAAVAALTPLARAAKGPLVQVWKSPTCGCCNDWIAILQKDGFTVKTFDEGNTAARQRAGIPMKLGSCHTALVGGYAVEGHVPVRDIRRLLAEKPDAIGLTVPGMPIGSPGMDGPEYGNRKDPYDVLLVLKDGSTRIWSSYR